MRVQINREDADKHKLYKQGSISLLMMWWLVILLIVIVLIIIGLIAALYNRFIILENRIDNSWAQIDVQLKKRADLVPNLVETVKGYAKHEKGIFTEVTKARSSLLKATTPEAKVKAGNQMADAMKSIFAIAENYPKLEASANFKALQEELTAIEDKIAYARQHYNDSVLSYNNAVERIPAAWFAKSWGKTEKKMLEIEPVERKVVKVNFE